uniref:Uncharacterized protein n=1 Tax=Knipowitschia caucasica TaxID=637954 RepID=A0AAV2KXQ8_KNICA
MHQPISTQKAQYVTKAQIESAWIPYERRHYRAASLLYAVGFCTRGEMEFEESGIGEECGVFGCVAAGEWPTQLEVAQILTLGLVALQHR